MTGPKIRIVVADANVLINLMHVARLGLCVEKKRFKMPFRSFRDKVLALPGRDQVEDASS